MLDVFREYIEEHFTDLNERLNTDLKVRPITSTMDIEELPASQTALHYMVRIDNTEYDTGVAATGFFNSIVNIEFFFNVVNKDYNIYKTKVDNYLFPLSLAFVESSSLGFRSPDNYAVKILELNGVSINNQDRFENDYYRPTISLNIRCQAASLDSVISATSNVLTS